MRIDFKDIQYIYIPNLNGGSGEIGAKMRLQERFKVIESIIPVGASIGMHTHSISIDFNYVVSGEGIAVCDGEEERLSAGVVHCCPIGSAHYIENTGKEDLVLIAFVPELKEE